MDKYDALKLKNQLCFPLYVCAREITGKYRPYLDKLNLTYTQYIVMLVLWEQGEVSAKNLGELLYLDSGTLTPLLKSLEGKGYILRARSVSDERILSVSLTQKGAELRDQALEIPAKVAQCLEIAPEEAAVLYKILYEIIEKKQI